MAFLKFPTLNTSINVLTTKIEVNIETAIPIPNVRAKPLTGPDPNVNRMYAVIKEEIFEHFKERIIIIISHRFNNIILCDRIIYLKEGKIVDIDSHLNLFEKYTDYKELYLKQEKRGQKKKKVAMP